MTGIWKSYCVVRTWTNRLLTVGEGGWLARATDWAIAGLIMCNALAVVLETVDPVFAHHRMAFHRFEVFSVGVFTAEYVLRVWSATAKPGYSRPLVDRLRFASRPQTLLDLLAIAPFYVGTVVFAADLRVLRALRLFRFLRLLKLARYSESFDRLARVVENRAGDLLVAVAGTSLLLVVSSSLMYFIERGAQPNAFSSIPAALWWGVVTLTTVGYGDVYPVTPLGKVLAAVIAILGTGLFALPASILASGFITEDRSSQRCPHCGERLGD